MLVPVIHIGDLGGILSYWPWPAQTPDTCHLQSQTVDEGVPFSLYHLLSLFSLCDSAFQSNQ